MQPEPRYRRINARRRSLRTVHIAGNKAEEGDQHYGVRPYAAGTREAVPSKRARNMATEIGVAHASQR